MSRRNAEILLVTVIIARSTSYLLSKITMDTMGPLTLMGFRFLLAFAILAVIFYKRLLHIKKDTLLRGLAMGGLFFAVMCAELFGLRTTPSSTTSFLENTAVVFVPIFEAILCRKLPQGKIFFSACLTLFGVGLLTLKGSGFSLHFGEMLCILAAVFYAASLILTDRLSRKDDAFVLGILQVGFMGLFGMIGAFLFETPTLPQSGTDWLAILFLAIVCSSFGFTLQPVAQKYTTSERSGILCAVNPVAASVLGVIFLDEQLGLYGIAGAVLVMAGILIATIKSDSAKQ